MRRFVSTASAVAVMSLAACGGEADPGTQTPAVEPAPAQEPAPAAPMNLPAGVTAEMVAEGRAIFSGVGICVACHGPDATGVGNLAPDLTDDTWLNISSRDYDEIVNLIMTGVAQPVEAAAPMPPKGGSSITDEQVRAVAAYVYTLSQ